jgi:peroxiredoxin
MKVFLRLLTLPILLASVAISMPSLLRGAESSSQKTAPAWELKDVDGKTVKSSDFKGKVVVLDFWATWCAPCRQEIPGFVELQNQYGKDGLVIVGISLDDQGPKVVKPFMMDNGKTAELFGGVDAIPTTFVIDREGKIIHKHVGFVAKSQFEKEIKALLK